MTSNGVWPMLMSFLASLECFQLLAVVAASAGMLADINLLLTCIHHPAQIRITICAGFWLAKNCLEHANL
eukprot:882666-Pleurochrysis_carterae.AAC.1